MSTTVPTPYLHAPARPVIVDLGSTRKKKIRSLKKGKGKLMIEVSRVLEEVRAGSGDEFAGMRLVPIVILYKKKRRKTSVLPLGN